MTKGMGDMDARKEVCCVELEHHACPCDMGASLLKYHCGCGNGSAAVFFSMGGLQWGNLI